MGILTRTLETTWLRARPAGARGRALLGLTIGSLLLLSVPTGCGPSGGGGDGGGGPFDLGENADIELDPSDTERTIIDSALAAGETLVLLTGIQNQGVDPLEIEAISLSYSVPDGASDGPDPAFALMEVPTLPSIVHPYGGEDYPQGVEVRIRYTRQGDDITRTATLTIESSDSNEPSTAVTFSTESGLPTLFTSPGDVAFGLVPDGETHEETIQIGNSGERTLLVSGFQITKDGRFGVKGDDFEIGGSPANALAVDLSSAIGIPPGETWPLTVTFTSDSPSPSEGELLIFSDDPQSGTGGHVVPLTANKSGPCILVEPRDILFGGQIVGQATTIAFDVTSCGTEPLTITGLALTGDSSTDYEVDYSGLPEHIDKGDGPSATAPLLLPINESVSIPVTYIADEVNPKDADNVPIPDLGTVRILSNAFESEVDVSLLGAGAEADCPTPVIHVVEGDEVIPQTVVHLDGTQSYAPFGQVVKFNWQVTEPDGSQGKFIPTPSDPTPIFEVNVVGLYEFRLDVWDEANSKSCNPAIYQIIVQPDQAIHVELSWLTPSDPDETDEGEGVGTDLDLHFTHPNATGPDLDEDGLPDPWFDQEWDCFWYNPNPNWGSFDPFTDDDPSVDRDDTDGAGPENVNLGIPENGTDYGIGVHYWDDHEFDQVLAQIRVFVYATEIYARTDVLLSERDMWWVGTLHWPESGNADEAWVEPWGEDAEKITPNYVNPFFFTPF